MRLMRMNSYHKIPARYMSSSHIILQLTGGRQDATLNRGGNERWPNITVNKCIFSPCTRLDGHAFWRNMGTLQQSKSFSTNTLQCMAGHSHWANIKFKKMHKDVERSKRFGKLALEIISAVKENGPDPLSNSKLEGIISRAKAVKMPKDSIESAIKSALRAGSEAQTQLVLEVRGPGRCGLLLDILTANLKRTKPEIITILKKNSGLLSEGGSVSFMFQHKGVVTIESSSDSAQSNSMAEDMAILCGAEDFFFDKSEDGESLLRFICSPLDLGKVKESLTRDHNVTILSANEERIAVKLADLDENQVAQADRLIDLLNAHPDVMRIFDNIKYYPSPTLKRDES